MAGPSNASFIPKRGAAKRTGKSLNGKVYVLTIVSYVMLFATLVATGGVYLYGQFVDRQLENEISLLNTEISSFREADMQRVQEFDLRLQQANHRLNNSVSVVSIFDSLEAATIGSVQMNSLLLERERDDVILVEASIETDSFDSSLFQRGVFERNDVVQSVDITGLQLRDGVTDGEGAEFIDQFSNIAFTARLGVPLSAIPYVPGSLINRNTVPTAPVETVEEVETGTTTNEITS